MAGVIVTGGSISTEEVLADEKKIDMDERFYRLKPDETQFTTMSSRLSSNVAIREKVNWIEEDLFPRLVANVGAQVAGDLTMTLVAGQGKVVQANDMLRNMRSGEAVRVTSTPAADVVNISRAVGNIAAAAINASDQWLVVADYQPQGADFPAPRYLQRVVGFNYTQITRTPWSFTGTATAIEYFGGREPAKEGKRKAVEHKRKWEAIGFFGARSWAASVLPDNDPQGSAGGLVEFISTYKRDANGPLTPDFFDLLLMDVMAYGESDQKVLFASPMVVVNMSKWNRSGMGAQWEPTPQDVHGVKVDAFISGAYGYRVPVVVKKEWAEFPVTSKGYGGYAFLADMSLISRRPLRDRDTKLLIDRQPRGKDTYASEYLTEATYQIANEKAHALIYGVTAPA